MLAVIPSPGLLRDEDMAGKSPLVASAGQRRDLVVLSRSRDRGEADRARAMAPEAVVPPAVSGAGARGGGLPSEWSVCRHLQGRSPPQSRPAGPPAAAAAAERSAKAKAAAQARKAKAKP
jgi:hypothetical protein